MINSPKARTATYFSFFMTKSLTCPVGPVNRVRGWLRGGLVTIFLAVAVIGQAQQSFGDDLWYSLYIKGDLDSWTQQLANLGSATTTDNLTERLYAEFGAIGLALHGHQKSVAKSLLSQADSDLKSLSGLTPNSATVLAFRAAFVGFHIIFAPWTAPFVGQGAWDDAHRSVKIAPEFPLAWAVLGSIQNNTPPLFGGSPEKAVQSWSQALKLALQPGHQHTWLAIYLQAELIRADLKLDQPAQADADWAALVAFEPLLAGQKPRFFSNSP